MHVLDIVQNSLSAGATLVEVSVTEDSAADRLTITVTDNGHGMTSSQLVQVSDPFYTTRTTRRVGLGLPMFRMAAEMTGGSLTLQSREGKGTVVTAVFGLRHIDRPPLGDMNGTVRLLITANPDRDFVYRRETDGRFFALDTRELREALEDIPLQYPEVAEWIAGYLSEQTEQL